ncbi:MAG: hypothetical protein M3R15_10855 [Acidobacteriota bacterium]|nr:hypothetical protein [Acidobacteriota bacterium]
MQEQIQRLEIISLAIASQTRAIVALREQLSITEANHVLDVQSQTNEGGKPQYPNEDTRKAAFTPNTTGSAKSSSCTCLIVRKKSHARATDYRQVFRSSNRKLATGRVPPTKPPPKLRKSQHERTRKQIARRASEQLTTDAQSAAKHDVAGLRPMGKPFRDSQRNVRPDLCHRAEQEAAALGL